MSLIADTSIFDHHQAIDTLLVAGPPDFALEYSRADFHTWLRRRAPKARRYGSVCTGAFFLGAAGLLDGLAARSGVFQSESGITPADFVEMARVDSARRLLEESDTPLQRVASRCGFASPDTMRRAFLRRIGTGPSDYRERFRRWRFEAQC
jgi:transcriptional regulator GlxA family with amidase domain